MTILWTSWFIPPKIAVLRDFVEILFKADHGDRHVFFEQDVYKRQAYAYGDRLGVAGIGFDVYHRRNICLYRRAFIGDRHLVSILYYSAYGDDWVPLQPFVRRYDIW